MITFCLCLLCVLPAKAPDTNLVLVLSPVLVLLLQMCIQGVTLSVSLCIALLNPGGAEKIYALVGASGVCIVCYVLPVWFHLKLMHVRRQAAKNQVGFVIAPWRW
jgi:hypothetical protein